MDVLLLGTGGREHALAWSLARSPLLGTLHAAPGNPGIATLAACHPVAADDPEAVLGLARSLGIDLVVVGPETPLVAGVADVLRHAGIAVFGPGAAAARIEGSKGFAKDVMDAVGVPTARRLEIPRAPCVVKADGLAAGKGVVVCRTDAELRDGLATVKAFGDGLVVEELLEGPEVSLFAVCDGRDAVSLPLARDYKRAFDGDEGPNTGGMGSVAPVPRMSQADADALLELTVRPVLTELERRHTPFIGTLFVGVILTADGPRVLEYNCRFGDPETQSVLATLDGDLLALLTAAAAGEVAGTTPVSSSRAAVTVVLTAGGYPESGSKGASIAGIAEAEALGAHVFHAGTAVVDGTLVTNGGRVLGVTGVGDGVPAARRSAYAACERISFDGVRYRADIAADAAAASAAG